MGKHKPNKPENHDSIRPPQPEQGPQSKQMDINQALSKLERILNTSGSLGMQLSENMENAINTFIAIVSYYAQQEQRFKMQTDSIGKELVRTQQYCTTLQTVLKSHKIEVPDPPTQEAAQS